MSKAQRPGDRIQAAGFIHRLIAYRQRRAIIKNMNGHLPSGRS